jgi:hypothetical protein
MATCAVCGVQCGVRRSFLRPSQRDIRHLIDALAYIDLLLHICVVLLCVCCGVDEAVCGLWLGLCSELASTSQQPIAARNNTTPHSTIAEQACLHVLLSAAWLRGGRTGAALALTWLSA